MAKKIYISGKITGIESVAAKRFDEAESFLKDLGYEPVNPMKLNHKHDGNWTSYMKEDIKALCDCDEIYVLDNFIGSEGARLEIYVANKLELPIHFEGIFKLLHQ